MKLCHECSADVRYCGHDSSAARCCGRPGCACELAALLRVRYVEAEAKGFDNEESWCRQAGELDAAVYFQNLARMTRLGQVSLDDVLGRSGDSLARVHLAGCSHLTHISPWLPPSSDAV